MSGFDCGFVYNVGTILWVFKCIWSVSQTFQIADPTYIFFISWYKTELDRIDIVVGLLRFLRKINQLQSSAKSVMKTNIRSLGNIPA